MNNTDKKNVDIDKLLQLSYDKIKAESPNKKFHYTNIEKDVNGQFKKVVKIIPFDLYSKMLYRSIEVNLASMLYKELMKDTEFSSLDNCSLFMEIKIKDGNGVVNYNGYESNVSNFNIDDEKLVTLFVNDIDSCGEFTAIDIGIGETNVVHNTFLMVENIKGNMVFNYYDPHGSENSFSLELGVDKLLDSLVENMIQNDKKFKRLKRNIIINKRESSCPIGMQSVTSDYDIGYCVIFTMLWVSSVLYIINYMIKNNVYIPSINWIKKVEQFYVKKPAKELYEKVVGFGSYLFNLYIKLNEKEGKNILKNLYKNKYSLTKEEEEIDFYGKPVQLVSVTEEYLTDKELKEMQEQEERLKLIKSIGKKYYEEEKQELKIKSSKLKKGKSYKSRLTSLKKEIKKKIYPISEEQKTDPRFSMEAYDLAIENEKTSNKEGNFIGEPCKINIDCKSNCCVPSEDENGELEFSCSPKEYCE